MRFGKSWEDVKKEPKSSGGAFINYVKDAATLRILDEPDAWEGAWEHFKGKSSFPCTTERDTCPGCTDPDERVKKGSRKIYFNAVYEYDGKFRVGVWKVTRTIAEKLELRAKKNGTIRDRDYIITKIQVGDKTDYDLDSNDKDTSSDLSEYDKQRKDPNRLLVDAFIEANGQEIADKLGVNYDDLAPDPSAGASGTGSSPESSSGGSTGSEPDSGSSAPEAPAQTERDAEIERLKAQLKEQQEKAKEPAKADSEPQVDPAYVHPDSPQAKTGDPNDPPFDPTPAGEPAKVDDDEVDPGEFDGTVEDLRAMTKGKLVSMITTEAKFGRLTLPSWQLSNKTQEQLIEWLLEQ